MCVFFECSLPYVRRQAVSLDSGAQGFVYRAGQLALRSLSLPRTSSDSREATPSPRHFSRARDPT